ncbi:MAG TPA: dTDP-glucose 4,6-dehydratase [Ruminiclostridium sp.]|nr:dTDP-glucose 4,6-dehydratase [Ruminiclostridium sp.]
MKVILVTGGAGFIGSNFIKYFLRRNKNYIIANIDKLTYAGKLDNLRELENSPRYHFIKGDICNSELVDYVLRKYRPSYIINFAAESDVDRSINHPSTFIGANVMGTLTLLEGARFIWGKGGMNGNRFIQISTDEVYGSACSDSEYFMEESPLMPNNPYSASKASADLLVRAFSKTYGMPAIITRCCNNYGPFQNMEKFIPTCITNALQDKQIPVYGDGSNVREWIYVLDHCIAIIRALFYGKPGETYNIGTGEKLSNIDLARKILKLAGKPEDLIHMVADRPGHDKRYSLNSYKARNNLSWSSKYSLDDGLKETVQWYKDNTAYWKD